MINHFILQKIADFFPFEPTSEQFLALQTLSDFLISREKNSILLLKGYAGTGKTTLLGSAVKMMDSLSLKSVLLAPTGRAAKVFAEYSGHAAYTIHKKIYRQKSSARISTSPCPPACRMTGLQRGNPCDTFIGEKTLYPFKGGVESRSLFTLLPNLHKDTLFIVDEASMISNDSAEMTVFGSGCLLDDLIQYVYTGDNCRLILMGDSAQLPPVSLSESPALNPAYLKSYHLHITEIQLTQVVRQQEDSGILFNATNIRNAIRDGKTDALPKILTEKFIDIRKISGYDLIEELSTTYNRDGIDQSIIICRSNKYANIYNNGVRNRILYREEELSSGDRLMVVKNNYFWGKDNNDIDFIANGEIVQVLRVRNTEEVHGFRFCNIKVRFEDYDLEAEMKIILDTLQSEAPALSKEANDKLFASVAEEYTNIRAQSERIKKIKDDPFFNAVQVKFAYAVTCHKAQGGQWSNVFLDTGFVAREMLNEGFFRWLYTAFTRATKRLYLINYE